MLKIKIKSALLCISIKKKSDGTGNRPGKSEQEWTLGWQEEKAKQNNHKNIPTKQTYFTCSFCFTFHTYINWILVVYSPHMPHSPCLLPPFLEGSLLSKTLTLVQHPLHTD